MVISPYWLFFIIAIYIIEIVINYMALMWIYRLEEISCKCSQNWKRDYIKYILYIYLVMTFVSLVINIYLYVSKEEIVNIYYRYISFIFNIIVFASLIIAIVYIDELKKNNCTCSEDIRREVFWYYNIIMLSLLSFMYLMIIILYLLLKY